MRTPIVFTLFALLLFASTACGKDGGFSDEEAQDAAQQALLALDDFPTGWVERPREEDEDENDLDFDLPPECQAFVEQENPPGAVASAESETFHGPGGEEVESSVNVFADTGAAEDSVQQLKEFVTDCGEPFETALLDVFSDAFEQELDEESGEVLSVDDLAVSVNFDRLSFPAFGDDSVALRMSISVEFFFEEFNFFLDLVGLRVGNMTGGFSFESTDEPPDPAAEEELLGIIADKVAEANSELN